MAVNDTKVIAVANAPRSYVEPDYLSAFTGMDDIREALHRLDGERPLIPLSTASYSLPASSLSGLPHSEQPHAVSTAVNLTDL